jgi:uncharacterized protein
MLLKVVCAIIIEDGRIIVTQRSETMKHSLKWEFPGGKLLEEEQEITGLIREIHEELNITIIPFYRLKPVIFQYSDNGVELIPYLSKIESGQIQLKEHKTVHYLELTKWEELDWLEADIGIVHQLIKLNINNLMEDKAIVKNKTLVLGASPKEDRYSNMAVKRLKIYGFPVVAEGFKEDIIDDTLILAKRTLYEDIDTITLYLSAKNQIEYYDYILALKPKRVIFNPGTENPELYKLLKEAGIEYMEACTLVMLNTGQYSYPNSTLTLCK